MSTSIKAIFTNKGFVGEKVVDKRETFALVLEASPFYAEAGGQINDLGQIEVDGVLLDVIDVQSYGGFTLHTCVLSEEAMAEPSRWAAMPRLMLITTIVAR